MHELDIDISQAKVKTISQKIIDESENIIIMCKKEQCPNFLLKSKDIIFWDIDDPFEMLLNDTRIVRDIIKGKVFSLIK